MNICLIMDNPETTKHPVIALALQRLSAKHTVRMLDVRTLTGAEALAQERTQPQADLYLLKSHAPQALDVAHVLEQQNAVVLNSWAASRTCQDRVLMAKMLYEAHLPAPMSWHFNTLSHLLTNAQELARLSFPLILKSRYSHRGDLVTKINSRAELELLHAQWGQEPIIVQEFLHGDSWDNKFWVIDEHVFAARRRTPLEPNAAKEDIPLTADAIPTQWAAIVYAVGHAFNLRLYGVDLLLTERGPMLVDINSFPGFRGVPHAEEALVALVERVLAQEVEKDI